MDGGAGAHKRVDAAPGSVDGFWLPEAVWERIGEPRLGWQTASFSRGRECGPRDHGAVTARWPLFEQEQWGQLLAALAEGRRSAPRGAEAWERLRAALAVVGRRLADPADAMHTDALLTLPAYTGYSDAMIGLLLNAPALWSLDDMSAAYADDVPADAAHGWRPLGRLPGFVRFYPAASQRRAWRRRRRSSGDRAIFAEPSIPRFVLGYGAGNIPGAALLIVLLSLATVLTAEAPPVLVVRNSRREPIFTPLVLTALAEADPELVGSLAVLVWDYDRPEPQASLMDQADLVVAAAADETIARVEAQAAAAAGSPRFHGHGHKLSFSAVAREVLHDGPLDLAALTLLTGLDSAFWDQNGCLSSRVHFVERGDAASPLDYAQQLALQLRRLAGGLPRGAWPRSQLHDAFDKYVALQVGGRVQVLSGYDDEFVVVLDERRAEGEAAASVFQGLVNDCQGRIVVVRAVDDLLEVPSQLRQLPSHLLQSMSMAAGLPGEALDGRLLAFAEGCGRCGVTAFRVAGRAAMPQLAYSWDGLLPLDLVRRRPAGRFATIEFDSPWEAIAASAAAIPLAASP